MSKASTQCAHPQKDDQAECAWVVGYKPRSFTCTEMATNPTTSLAQCTLSQKVTMLLSITSLHADQFSRFFDQQTTNNNNNHFTALCPGLPGWTGTRRNTHPPTHRHRIFKLGGRVDHVTRHVWTLTKVKRSNEATDGRINFKLGGNCHREVRITWHTF